MQQDSNRPEAGGGDAWGFGSRDDSSRNAGGCGPKAHGFGGWGFGSRDFDGQSSDRYGSGAHGSGTHGSGGKSSDRYGSGAHGIGGLRLGGLSDRVQALLRRHRWPALVLLLGVLLLLWNPARSEPAPAPEAPTEPEQSETLSDEAQVYRRQVEQELTRILSQVRGAGRVSVMLTLKTGPVTRYQTDASTARRDSGAEHSESREESTVILSRGSAYNEPAVVHRAYPMFQGALVVSQGAEDPAVRLALCQAVASLLGLGADQITVVKMK